ncbi:MAG: hypothetical protein QXJ75_05290 [Candidatus Bathyarchaeia archaeon]
MFSTVSVAHWSDRVEIRDIVEMGSLTTGFTDILGCGDNEDLNMPPKDVGSVECKLTVPETDTHTGKTVYKKLDLVIGNVYPSYEAWCELTVDNAGTIPVVTKKITFTELTGALTYDAVKRCFLDASGNEILDVVVDPDPVGQQIDPCDSFKTRISIHAKQGAEQCHTYAFEVEVVPVQWNKYSEVDPDPQPNPRSDPNPGPSDKAPHIEENTFSMETYAGGLRCLRSEAKMPYTFYGETVKFKVNITDEDGISDIDFDGAAKVILSSDEVISLDDFALALNLSEIVDATCGNFEGEWSVPADYGLFNIFIVAFDSDLTPADNCGVKVGGIFLNPRVMESVSSPSLSFGSVVAGNENVSAAQNPFIVTNMDPDNVGMKIDIFIYGTDLSHEFLDAKIPVSNIRVEGGSGGVIYLSAVPQKIDTLSSGASGSYCFYLDAPPSMPAGDYNGKVTIQPVENSFG